MSKRAAFRDQREYRFVFGERRLIEVYGTDPALVFREDPPARRDPPGPPRFLEVGDLRAITRTHRWPKDP